MSDESMNFDFDALEDLKQSNAKEAQYELKRNGENKFTLSDKGKAVIKYNSTKGVNVKSGNGTVVIGCLDKEDEKCTRGLLNGAKGNIFFSNKFEGILKQENLIADEYKFEELKMFNDTMYYKVIPIVSKDEGEDITIQEAALTESDSTGKSDDNISEDDQSKEDESSKSSSKSSDNTGSEEPVAENVSATNENDF